MINASSNFNHNLVLHFKTTFGHFFNGGSYCPPSHSTYPSSSPPPLPSPSSSPPPPHAVCIRTISPIKEVCDVYFTQVGYSSRKKSTFSMPYTGIWLTAIAPPWPHVGHLSFFHLNKKPTLTPSKSIHPAWTSPAGCSLVIHECHEFRESKASSLVNLCRAFITESLNCPATYMKMTPQQHAGNRRTY